MPRIVRSVGMPKLAVRNVSCVNVLREGELSEKWRVKYPAAVPKTKPAAAAAQVLKGFGVSADALKRGRATPPAAAPKISPAFCWMASVMAAKEPDAVPKAVPISPHPKTTPARWQQ